MTGGPVAPEIAMSPIAYFEDVIWAPRPNLACILARKRQLGVLLPIHLEPAACSTFLLSAVAERTPSVTYEYRGSWRQFMPHAKHY